MGIFWNDIEISKPKGFRWFGSHDLQRNLVFSKSNGKILFMEGRNNNENSKTLSGYPSIDGKNQFNMTC